MCEAKSSSETHGQLFGAKRSKLGKCRSGESFQEGLNEPKGNEFLQCIAQVSKPLVRIPVINPNEDFPVHFEIPFFLTSEII